VSRPSNASLQRRIRTKRTTVQSVGPRCLVPGVWYTSDVGLAMPVVWTDRHRLHEPDGEVWVGIRTPGTELPARAERIRGALASLEARFVETEPQPDAALLEVHDPELLAYLAAAWDDWEAAGLTDDPGQDRVVPYLFAHPALLTGHPSVAPTAVTAKAGRFAYDTMTLIGPGTWEAARAAVDVALTAVDLVLAGRPAAYACCRPPGHHATRSGFGGSCYLNNTAASAARMRAALGPVAVIDVDAHHGNGTQEIFYSDPEVATGSVHVDPGAGWFPHYLGFASELGSGAGAGANRNVCLEPGSVDEAWLEAVAELAVWAQDRGARGLVVALGVDAAGDDPESPLQVTEEGFRAAGRVLGGLGLPTVIVQEGGYALDSIGALVAAALQGVEDARPA
jgi:acetoin utilization deacetylase AcuC-like enzyme